MTNKKFVPRLTLLSKNDPNAKYYKTKSSGGYNTAIKGNNSKRQRNKDFDVLPNCVGWAIGRFHEILQDPTFSKLKAVNAELFIKYADKSLKISNTPQVGSVIVWEGLGSHPGHVAVVEKIVNSTEIVTSESGWSGKDFWVTQRKQGTNKNWGQNTKTYKFLGFILNPAPCCQNGNTTTNSTTNASTANVNTSTNLTDTSTNSSNTSINSIVNQNKTVQSAKLKDTKLSGTYTVIADDGLNLRLGAGIDFESILLMPKGTKISNYGFYNAVGSVKWLYVQCVINGKKYLGYCSINYLKKQ